MKWKKLDLKIKRYAYQCEMCGRFTNTADMSLRPMRICDRNVCIYEYLTNAGEDVIVFDDKVYVLW